MSLGSSALTTSIFPPSKEDIIPNILTPKKCLNDGFLPVIKLVIFVNLQNPALFQLLYVSFPQNAQYYGLYELNAPSLQQPPQG